MHRSAVGAHAVSLLSLLAAPTIGASLRQEARGIAPCGSESAAREVESGRCDTEPPRSHRAHLETTLPELLRRYSEFSGAIAVRTEGETVHATQGSFRGRELQSGTVFPIGSLAKLFGAAWLLQREERVAPEERVLDRPLAELRPELPWGRLATATPRDLLHHRAGIVGPADLKVDPWNGPKYFERFVQVESARGRNLTPRSRAMYSNVGFALTGYVVSQDCAQIPGLITTGLLGENTGILFWGDKRFEDTTFDFADAGSVRVRVRDQFQRTPSWNNILANGMLASAPALVRWQGELLTPGALLPEQGLTQLLAADHSGFGAGCMVRRLPDGSTVIANTGSDRDGNPAFLAGTRERSVAVLSCLPQRSERTRGAYRAQTFVVLSTSIALVGDTPECNPAVAAPRVVGTYVSPQGRVTIGLDSRNPDQPYLTISAPPSEVSTALTSRSFDHAYLQQLRDLTDRIVGSGFVDGVWSPKALDWSGFLHGGSIREMFPHVEEFLHGAQGKVSVVAVRPTLNDQTLHTVFLRDGIGNHLGLRFCPDEATGKPLVMSSQFYPVAADPVANAEARPLQTEGLMVERALIPGTSGALYFCDGEARVPVARLMVDEAANLRITVAGYPEFILVKEAK